MMINRLHPFVFDTPPLTTNYQVMACLPPADWAITPENSVGRRDLRDLPVMSIDPPVRLRLYMLYV